MSQSDKFKQVDAFLDRVEIYKDKKEEKMKLLDDQVTKDCTF